MGLVHLISLKLRELRFRHGFTQEEMAELIGISMRHYQAIEAGHKKHIWLETVEKMAWAFCLETSQFLSPELPEQTTPRFNVAKSAIHYQRRRKGPYQKRPKKIS